MFWAIFFEIMLTWIKICDILLGYITPQRCFFRRKIMAKAKKTKRAAITLACTECKNRNYDTSKNTAEHPDRIELNKYCPTCRKHTTHKETK